MTSRPRVFVKGISLTPGALLFLALSLPAQQPGAGRVFNPTASPNDPDLVAYEKLSEDVREIEFVRLPGREVFPLAGGAMGGETARDILSFGPPGARDDSELVRFSGDLDWRPSLDRQRRQWFAYVTGDAARGTILNLSHFDGDGELASEPLRVELDMPVRTPRWSPDGRHLAIAGGGRIWVLRDVVDDASSGRRVEPVQVSPGDLTTFFPAWSPDGREIAYQIRIPDARGGNWAIAVSPVGSARSAPAVVTESLGDYNEYRPSWSPDGSYLAYYVDQAPIGSAADESLLDVGIVELLREGGRTAGGEVKAGRSRRIATNVIPNEISGPAWSLGASAEEQVVLYVVKDEGAHNPIAAASLRSWLAMDPSDRYRTLVSEAGNFGTVNHRFVSSLRLPRARRFLYVSQVGDGEEVQIRDVPAEGPAAADRVAMVERQRSGALFRSALFPGWGQTYKGESKGKAMMIASGVTGAAMGALVAVALGKRSDMQDATGGPAERARAVEDYKAARNRAIGYVGGTILGVADPGPGLADLALAYWLFNLIDASRGFPVTIEQQVPPGRVVARIEPTSIPATDPADGAQLGLRLRLSLLHR